MQADLARTAPTHSLTGGARTPRRAAERYLRRHRGSYGPAFAAGERAFPGHRSPIDGLWCCGDSTFPGIGVPAVAGSGIAVANSIAPLGKHLELLDELRAADCLR